MSYINPMREKARKLYLETDLSRAEIAKHCGTKETTLNTWVVRGKWKRDKDVIEAGPESVLITEARKTERVTAIQLYVMAVEAENLLIASKVRKPKIEDVDRAASRVQAAKDRLKSLGVSLSDI